MKLSTKPISSPGRTDKFPPPLMRFLRSNAGNRSRGRSRTSPMFLRKKNTTIETQEPSSPKVTCMGQVRVKRSTAKRGRHTSSGEGAPTRCRCCFWWVPQTLFCNRRKKPGSCCNCQCQPVRFNWGFFRRRKASDVTEASTNFRGRPKNELEKEETENEERVKANFFVSNSSSTPPRNALLLTRCRSAPYSSSSLASRFWGSPLRNEEKTEVENREPSENQNQRPSESVLEQEEGIKDTKLEQKLRFFKELEDSVREKIIESEKFHELNKVNEETEEGDSVRPLVLTRCKSEPARTARKLDTCSPHGFV